MGAPTTPVVSVVVDASPWGVGGILYRSGLPSLWFGESVSRVDSEVLCSVIGVSDSTTAFESLALLVAVRYFASHDDNLRVAIRSDSLSTLLGVQAGRARSHAVNRCVAEIALLRAERGLEFVELRHIPGSANDAADALSRRFAPVGRPVPAHLDPSLEVTPVPRTRAW